MRATNKTYNKIIDFYRKIDEYEKAKSYSSLADNGLSSIFLISQNMPMREVYDFFSGYSFSLMESYEELECSHKLIKFGFYKQSMISLRVALEIGLLSVYWNIFGKDSVKFKEWFKSKENTPRKDNDFWNTIKTNKNISCFDERYKIIDEIKTNSLSNFVHTKGLFYSNYHQRSSKEDPFDGYREWLLGFKNVVRYIEIFHLLLFPTLNIRHSTSFLLRKFGTFGKMPIFGAGHGDEMHCIYSFIPNEQKEFIIELTSNDAEVKYIKKWLNGLPDLTEGEVVEIKIEEAKTDIKMGGGFSNWKESPFYYSKTGLSKVHINKIEEWAKENGFY